MTVEQKSSTPFDLDKNESESMEELMREFGSPGEVGKGTITTGTVIDVVDREVYLHINGKQEGRCDLSEFEAKPVQGDTVEVIVLSRPEDGPVKLSKKEADSRRSWSQLKESFEAGTQLTGKVEKKVNHGYIIDFNGVQLFLPLSHSGVKGRIRNLGIGKKIDFKILELKERHHSAVVSHRRVIEERNDTRWGEILEKYKEGDVIEGAVSKIVSFGVFVDVGGIEGLLHQSDISWKKYAPFKDRFKTGQKIQVKLLTLDKDNNRISLGYKQLSEDPWEWAKRELGVGDVVRGRVTSITDYGAFLEILEGLEGLIHITELTWSKRLKHPKKFLKLGDEVEAQVLTLDYENKRIGLGLRQLQADPWHGIAAEIHKGDILEGEVTSITRFGAFVRIKDDVEGLIHFNDYSWDEKIDRKMLKKGDQVKYIILDVDESNKRISCGIKQLSDNPYETLRKKYKKGDAIECKITSITGFGIFVDIGDGFEGLIHVSRIPVKQDEKLEDHYKVGDSITAVLIKIDSEQKKIALSIKDLERKNEREFMSQYIKKDNQPSTSSLGAFMKKEE